MSTRHALAMIVVFCTLSQVGCVCMMNSRCGSGGCGFGGCDASCGVADTCCDCPSCGVADSCCNDSCCGDCASCGVADVSCGCPDACCDSCEASCGCSDTCCGGTDCGSTPVRGRYRCPLLTRLKNAICGCNGCGGQVYYSEWHCDPPCECENCDCYGNYTGPYGSAYGRRAQLAKKNIADELRFSEGDSETIYR